MLFLNEAETPWIIDVEASGFGPHSYPIEVGLALDKGQKFCSLVLPPDHWTHWDMEAEKVHRISRDILEDYGKPTRQVAETLNELLDGKTVYTDGWVVDNTWIIKLFHAARVEPHFRTSSLEMILNEDQMRAWHETKDLIVAEAGQRRHRASFDAYVIQQTWLRTRSATTKEG